MASYFPPIDLANSETLLVKTPLKINQNFPLTKIHSSAKLVAGVIRMNYQKLQYAILIELRQQLFWNLIPAKENMPTYNEDQDELVEALYSEYKGWA